ncbi:MAG: alpha/beta hydrolase fold domain-containing protein [Oscillospiraceae bacterium]|nr:alpha/beta hydrolase fold domain-containing protein [Oscillospiraceae bacterium]
MILEKTAASKRMQMCVRSNQQTGKLLHFDSKATRVNWKAVRAIANVSYAMVPRAKGVKVTKEKGSDIKGYLCTPKELKGNSIVICIHGGGMLCGSAFGSLGFATDIAKKSGYRTYSLEYGLAPENKFPKGLEDVYTAYSCIAKENPDSDIFVTGESAGAYLTIALTCLAIKKGIRVPSAIFPHSPVIDLSGSLDRTGYELKDPILAPGALEAIVSMYCPTEDLTDYRLSPLYFDEFEKFPPVILTADANEYLKADSLKLHEILAEKGVDIKMYLYHGTYHAFAVTGSITDETEEILNDIVDLMRKVSA